MKRTVQTLLGASVVLAIGVASVAYVGLINVGADDPHSKPVHAFLNFVRERSIAVRAKDIEVPALDDPALIRSGAGNYNAMCIGCHLAPGVAATELSQSLYPAPPNLAVQGSPSDPAISFWIVKHGIKATGMPAWGKSMGDDYLWGLVAFLQQLPSLDAAGYQSLVASSAGHQHGGGESQMHNHEGQHKGTKAAHHATKSAPSEDANHHGSAQTEQHDDAAASSEDHHASSAVEPHTGEASKTDAGAPHHPQQPAQEQPAAASAPKTHNHPDGKEHVHER